MSEPAAKVRARRAPPGVQRAAAKAPAAQAAAFSAGPSGLLQRARPAVGLGVQRQVAVGEPGDRFEREADAAADRVSAGHSVEPSAMSPVSSETLAQTAATPEKMPEAMPVQKAAAAPEKTPEAMPVQKAAAAPERMPEAMPVQKAAPTPEKLPEAMPVQKAVAAPEKLPEAMPVQKAAATPEKMPEAMPVQKAAPTPEKMPEAMPVQKKRSGPGPEEQKRDTGAVQKAGAAPDEKMPVQTEAAGGGAPAPAASTASAASDAIASKGAGKPLDPATRGTLESGLGADLSHVRVHDDSAAQTSARALDARAFTHGSDIWLGPGASQNDTRLMAHEATHVVQQAGGVHRMVQKAPQPAAGKGKSKEPLEPVTLDGKIVKIPKLRMPIYDRKANSIEDHLHKKFPFALPLEKPARPSDQRQVWARDVADASFPQNIKSKVDKINPSPKRYSETAKREIYYLRPANDMLKNIIGDASTLPGRLTTPTWDKNGKHHYYDVDHIAEIQLGGSNSIDNMELLDRSANRSSGASIAADIDKKTTAAARQLSNEGKIPKDITDLASLRSSGYTVEFQSKDASYEVVGTPSEFWSVDAVRAGEHVDGLKAMTAAEIKSVTGDKTRLTLMTTRGFRLRDIDHWEEGKTEYKRENFFPLFDLETVTYDPKSGSGEIAGTLLPRHPPLVEQPGKKWKINHEPGIDYGGSLEVGLKTLGVKALSPIEIDEVDLGPKGLIVHGVVQPTVPLLKGAALDFRIEGTEIEISKTFSGSELSAPGPIKITGSSLTVALSRSQLKATGDVDFAIERLGHGQISGTGAFGGDAGKGFGVKGYFELDKSVFDGEARIDAGYENDEFWAKGHLAIGAGKIRGIKSASLDASYAKDKFGATGSVIPDIPAVEQASLAVDYDPNVGLKFVGDLALKPDTPGIGAGQLHVEAFEPAGSDHFKVSAKGSAKPKIPGVNSDLMVAYDDGAFDASVTAAYSRGRLSGSIMVGATNRPVTDGQPSGPAPEKGGAITIYGGGSLTITIGALQGTAAVHLLPNGEIEVAGEIDLTTNNFPPEKKFDKNIFTLHLDIPIFGITVPVVDTHIGIFATVEGGLDVNAGIGPGVLTGKLGIDYNPAHEENAKLWGGAQLHVPANAGLRVFVSGGIGAGIPLVDATAKLTIGAGLGLEGALDTGVQIDWSPAKGLSLDANASVYVEPKLKVSVTGSVDVVFDTWVHTFHLYHHDWDLAAFEFGSNLRFGVCFPVHYDDSKGFDLSLDKVKFQVPDIKPKEILSDVISRIV